MSSPDNDVAAPREADRYRILLEASRTLGAKLSPDELHEAIYRATAQAVEASGFYLALHDQGHRDFREAAPDEAFDPRAPHRD